MWKKVLYLGVTIIFGFMVYIIAANSNQMNHLESLVKNAIESEKFHEVPMVWDGCFDTKSIVENNTDKMDIVLYPATSQTDITYGPEDNSSRFVRYEKAYYLYIFNTKYSLESVKTGSETSYNQSGVEFENGDKKFTYYFIVDEKMNSSSYIAAPTTKEEALLNNSRDVTATNSVWNFMRVTFTETMLNQIAKELDGKIETISIKDSEGALQYSSNVVLDFSQPFFTDVKDLFDNYNIYLDEYVAAGSDKDKVKAAQEKFNTFYNPWYDEFLSKTEETGYTFRFDNDVLTPSKLTWQTIGIVVLYAAVVAVVYVLLFHFKAIRRIFSRDTYKKYSSDSKVLVNGKWVDRSQAKAPKTVSSKSNVIVEPDTKADESLETVSAVEVVSEPKEVVLEEQPAEEVKEDAKTIEAEIDEITPEVKQEEAIEPVAETLEVVEQPAEEPILEEAKTPAEEKKTPTKKTATSKTTAKSKTTTTAKKPASSSKKSTSTPKTAPKKASTPKEKKDETN